MNQVASLSVLWQAEIETKKLKPPTFHHVGPEGRMRSLHEIIKVRESFSEKNRRHRALLTVQRFCLPLVLDIQTRLLPTLELNDLDFKSSLKRVTNHQ